MFAPKHKLKLKHLPKHQVKNQRGFTLIELVTVIVILGVLATGITSFLRLGTQNYTEAADRTALVSTVRFLVERLNREVRYALPSSIRTNGDKNQCLEFMPIENTMAYLGDLENVQISKIQGLMFAGDLLTTTQYVVVYAMDSKNIYDSTVRVGVTEELSSITPGINPNDITTINFANPITIKADSPTKRLYLTGSPVSYCVENQAIYRYQTYGFTTYNTNTGTPDISSGGEKVLMAEYVDNYSSSNDMEAFQTSPASLKRNSLALIRLKFVRNLEEIVFNNVIKVPNVP